MRRWNAREKSLAPSNRTQAKLALVEPAPPARALLQRRDRLGHFGRVAGGFHLLEHLGDAAPGVDDEGGARVAPVLPPVHRLLLPHAVLVGHGMPLVGEEG